MSTRPTFAAHAPRRAHPLALTPPAVADSHGMQTLDQQNRETSAMRDRRLRLRAENTVRREAGLLPISTHSRKVSS